MVPELSMEESLNAIPITFLFDSFCVYHLFSNCYKLCQKLGARLIFPVPIASVFDKRDVSRGLGSGRGHRVMIPLL